MVKKAGKKSSRSKINKDDGVTSKNDTVKKTGKKSSRSKINKDDDVTSKNDMVSENPQPSYTIQIQYLKDLSFENPNAPLVFTHGAMDLKTNVKIDVTVQKLQEQDFEVCIHLSADAKNGEEQAYLVEMVYGGVVRINNISQEMVQPLLFVEIPRLLFPYVRQILSTAVNEGRFPRLILAPFDFMGLFHQRVELAKAKANPANNTESASSDA